MKKYVTPIADMILSDVDEILAVSYIGDDDGYIDYGESKPSSPWISPFDEVEDIGE